MDKIKYAAMATVLATVMVLALIPAVSASYTVTNNQPSILSSDSGPLLLTLNSVHDGDPFTITIRSPDLPIYLPKGTYTFPTVGVPFGLKPGTATEYFSSTGLSDVTVTVSRDDGSAVTMSGSSFTEHYNINPGAYHVSISGTQTNSHPTVQFTISGTINLLNSGSSGSGSSESGSSGAGSTETVNLPLSPDLAGTVNVEVDGGANTFTQTFTITPPSTGSTAPEGPETSGYSAPPAGAGAPPAILAPTGAYSPTVVTLAHDSTGTLTQDYTLETDPTAGFSAAFGIVKGTEVLSGTGHPATQISVTPLSPAQANATISQGGNTFVFSGYGIDCEPSGAQFIGGSATISFTLNQSQWSAALAQVDGNTAAMTIEMYDPTTNTWTPVTTVVDPATYTISAKVLHFSNYALYFPGSTPLPAGTPVQTSSTPAAVTSAPTTSPQNTVTTAAAGPLVSPSALPTGPSSPATSDQGLVGNFVQMVQHFFGQ